MRKYLEERVDADDARLLVLAFLKKPADVHDAGLLLLAFL